MSGRLWFVFGFSLIIFSGFAGPVSAVETTIKGGKMEIFNKGDAVLFTDGVKLIRDNDVLLADQMRTNKTRDQVTAQGNVRLYRKISEAEQWRGFSTSGFYNNKNGEGYLLGKGAKLARLMETKVLSSTQTQNIEVFADRFDFLKENQKAVGTGHVYGWTVDPKTLEKYEFWSDRADYDGETKQVVLTGQTKPFVKQSKGKDVKTITGTRVIYYIDEERFIADGEAEAVFVDASTQTPKTKGKLK